MTVNAAIILPLSILTFNLSANYPIIDNLDSRSLLCYIELGDGRIIDLSQLCRRRQSNPNPATQSVPPNGRNLLPVRPPSDSGCLCPYDLDDSGQPCGTRSVYADGSPACYRKGL
ncbi:MAG: hypothetical protein AB4352_20220 [Hormoscilla sp.]